MFLIFLYFTVSAGKDRRNLQTSNDMVLSRNEQSCAKEANIPGFFWDGQQCLKCKQTLCLCSALDGCDDCKENYFLDFKSELCKPCPFGCLKCCQLTELTSLVCTLCQEGFQNIEGVCSHITGCLRFSSHGHCIQCDLKKYFYLSDDGTCSSCPVGCKVCYSQTYCVNCLDGYYYESEYDRSLNATERTSYLCYECNSDETKKCKFCEKDESGKGVKCLECFEGYFYDRIQFTCMQCLDNCAVCQDPQIRPLQCYVCMTGYIQDESLEKCLTCQDSFEHCLTCTVDNIELIGKFVCKQCMNGFYLDDQGACQNCRTVEQKGARRCEQLDKITQCQPGYLLVDNSKGAKQECIENINKCRKARDESGECETCIDQQELLRIDGRLQCVACSQQITNCLDCRSSSDFESLICQQCEDFYQVNNDDSFSECLSCSPNCIKCQDADCLKCDNGYYIDLTNKSGCLSCVYEQCIDCQQTQTTIECLVCSEGWGVHSNKGSCWKCQEGCNRCDFQRDKCNQCKDLYYNYEGACLAYPEHCLAANEDGYCYLCETITNVFVDIIDEIWPEESYDEFVDVNQTPDESATGVRRSRRRAQGIFDGLPTDESEQGDEAKDEGSNNCANNYDLSTFYKSVNGYCLICSDYQTGTYNCPVQCSQNTVNQQGYGTYISTTLGWILATIFCNY